MKPLLGKDFIETGFYASSWLKCYHSPVGVRLDAEDVASP